MGESPVADRGNCIFVDLACFSDSNFRATDCGPAFYDRAPDVRNRKRVVHSKRWITTRGVVGNYSYPLPAIACVLGLSARAGLLAIAVTSWRKARRVARPGDDVR
jgi:hypothetical protein